MKILTFWKKSCVLTALLYILLGLVLVIWPETTSTVVCYAFGGVILLYGLVHLAHYFSKKYEPVFFRMDLIVGLISSGIGLFILLMPTIVISILPFVMGLSIAVDGFINLQQSVDLRRAGYQNWWVALLLAAATTGLGILLLFNPFKAATTLVRVIGAILVYNGASDIWIVSRMPK